MIMFWISLLGTIATFLLIILVALIERTRKKERIEEMRHQMLLSVYRPGSIIPHMARRIK